MNTDNNGHHGVRVAVSSLVLVVAATAPTTAQRLFPDTPSFEFPVADPRPSGIYGRLLSVRRGESRFGAEREAEAAAGETFPVLALSGGADPVVISIGLGVAARFSLDDPRSALISTDWTVGLHGTARTGGWQFDLHVYHESSHLGDEYAESFDATRLDWTREVASISTSRRLGRFTAHGRVSYALIDELGLDRPAAAIGIDYHGSGGRWLGGRVRPVIGLYVDGAAYAQWKLTTTARAGLELQASGRAIGVSLIGLDGLSTQRQFYAERSRYFGFELRFDL